jgi:hypothetical protein
VRGVVVWLSYPVVLAFLYFVYPIALVYPAFAVFELSVLVLGLPVCVS